MTWNYRAVEKQFKGESYYEIHEVFYDDKGNIENMSIDPDIPVGDTLDELKKSLEMMLEDIYLIIHY